MLELKKSIGKMGSMVKSGAKVTFTKDNVKHAAKAAYTETKHIAGEAAREGSKAATHLADYGARVDHNASQSWLLNGPPQKEHHQKAKPHRQTIVININDRSHRRRRNR